MGQFEKNHLIWTVVYSSIWLSVSAFSWSSCGDATDPIKVTELNVWQQGSEQSLYVTGRAKMAVNVTSPTKMVVKVERKMFWGWTGVPCLDGFGSCTYDDACDLSPFKTGECPDVYKTNNLPCRCPISQGLYKAKNFPIDISVLPKWLERGHYRIKGEITASNARLICLALDIVIE